MMLVHALRPHVSAGYAGGPSWLTALAAIQDQPGHARTLQSLARCAGMSRTVFALRFKAVVGETAAEYLTRWRVLLAADRITSSHEPLAAIAASLGYASESSFGKAFRRVLGCSPRRFGRT